MEKLCEFIDANNNYDVVEYIFEFVNKKYRADFIKYYE